MAIIEKAKMPGVVAKRLKEVKKVVSSEEVTSTAIISKIMGQYYPPVLKQMGVIEDHDGVLRWGNFTISTESAKGVYEAQIKHRASKRSSKSKTKTSPKSNQTKPIKATVGPEPGSANVQKPEDKTGGLFNFLKNTGAKVEDMGFDILNIKAALFDIQSELRALRKGEPV